MARISSVIARPPHPSMGFSSRNTSTRLSWRWRSLAVSRVTVGAFRSMIARHSGGTGRARTVSRRRRPNRSNIQSHYARGRSATATPSVGASAVARWGCGCQAPYVPVRRGRHLCCSPITGDGGAFAVDVSGPESSVFTPTASSLGTDGVGPYVVGASMVIPACLPDRCERTVEDVVPGAGPDTATTTGSARRGPCRTSAGWTGAGFARSTRWPSRRGSTGATSTAEKGTSEPAKQTRGVLRVSCVRAVCESAGSKWQGQQDSNL